jgi:uncharacterized protein (DUF2237 family)
VKQLQPFSEKVDRLKDDPAARLIPARQEAIDRRCRMAARWVAAKDAGVGRPTPAFLPHLQPVEVGEYRPNADDKTKGGVVAAFD